MLNGRVRSGRKQKARSLGHYSVNHTCFHQLEYNKHLVSLQSIPEIPDDLKQLYKTVWEISQKTVLKMAAERGAFIDQSQSLNIHIAEPNYGKLTSMHFYGWKQVGGIH